MIPGDAGYAASDNQSLTSSNDINPSRLNKHQYTLSLLNEAQRIGLLSHQEVYSIQYKLMVILQDLIRRYTQGKSSSVATDTAESILTSILYAVDADLLNFEHPNQAITYLKTSDVVKLYERGVERVSQCLEEVKSLYKEVKQHKLDVPVAAYNTTIDESLPLFIKKYNILFEAHNTMASIDYPLAMDNMRLQGVFYMKHYLERLQLENEFCSRFNPKALIHIMESFGRLHRFDYRIELFNIFELCLHNSLFSILSGGDADQVQISAHQFERLERMLSQSDARGIEKMIHTSLKRLQYALQIHDPQTVDYMNQCSRELIGRILNAAKHDNLQSVIITDRPEKIKPVVMSIHTSNRMSDVRLRQLLDEVIRSETKEEKIRLIKSNFSSLHDYLDLLESDCLYGDEYEALYASFGDVELAILSKIVFYEELRGGDTELRTIVFQKKRAEFDWQVHLIEFMKRLSPSRVHTIEQLIDSICYEDIKFN